MGTTVGQVVQRVKTVLQETTDEGVRWKNAELVDWLNDSYQSIASFRPDLASRNVVVTLEEGALQQIPSDGERFLDGFSNMAESSDYSVITMTDKKLLDGAVRGWAGMEPDINIQHVMFDELDPKRFWVYPPAADGAEIRILYSAKAPTHDTDLSRSGDDEYQLPEGHLAASVEWMLYRAFSKDADNTSNLNRASVAYQSFMNLLGQKAKVDVSVSPNN